MSRIGKNPVIIPQAVNINYDSTKINIDGPKGKLSLNLRPEIILEKKENTIIVKRVSEEKKCKSMHGLYRMLINNMIIGVTNGFEKKLDIVGTGYKAAVEGKKLILNLGYSYPYEYEIPEGIKVNIENNTKIIISGIDKELVGHVAACVRKMRPPEPYKGKGIKYEDEIIRKKAGKAT